MIDDFALPNFGKIAHDILRNNQPLLKSKYQIVHIKSTRAIA